MTVTAQALSPWCRRWLASLADRTTAPPDRRDRLVAALSSRGRPFTEAIDHVDRVLYGIPFDQVRFGIEEALAAQDGMPPDDWPVSEEGRPLIPVSHPRTDPQTWCDDAGAMYTVLYDLGSTEPTYDSAEHLLECQAFQRVYLPERKDRYGFETQASIGVAAAAALHLPPVPEVDGKRCHAWADDRAVVIQANIEQYLYGTYVGLRDGAAVSELLAALPEAARKQLRIINGSQPGPHDREGVAEASYDIGDGRMQTHRNGDVVTVVYEPPTFGAR
ncbi:Hypothetical protein A7982_04565 [Minicystis rosea]|nr:Hypothetical protein A7982_04565 [Minicystis rosea]